MRSQSKEGSHLYSVSWYTTAVVISKPPLETTGVTHSPFHPPYSPLTTSILTTVPTWMAILLLYCDSTRKRISILYIKQIPDLCEIQKAHLQLTLFNSSYQITLHHTMHTNHPTDQQPAHTHRTLATLVLLKYCIIFEDIMKTKLIWPPLTFSKMMAGWIVDWLNEYPPPTRGYWKMKSNHNTGSS